MPYNSIAAHSLVYRLSNCIHCHLAAIKQSYFCFFILTLPESWHLYMKINFFFTLHFYVWCLVLGIHVTDTEFWIIWDNTDVGTDRRMSRFVKRQCNLTVLIPHSTVNVRSVSYDFLFDIFFSPADFIVTIQYMVHIIYKVCVHWLLLARLLINSRLLVVNCVERQKLHPGFSPCTGASALNSGIIQESAECTRQIFVFRIYYQDIKCFNEIK